MAFAQLLLLWSVSLFGAATAAEGQDSLLLTVAYCPDAFTGAGATVRVDPASGAWTIVSKFFWPDAIFGCIADYDPDVVADRATSRFLLDFTEDFGLLVIIDPVKARGPAADVSPHACNGCRWRVLCVRDMPTSR